MSLEPCFSTVCGRRACRSSRGPCGDAGNNPCRRQGDQVVAPSSRGRRLLVEDDHGASGGRRYRAARLRGGRRRRPVVLSQGARPRMGVPVGEGPLGHAQDDLETFGSGRRFAPALARGCGRRHAPGRRARVSSEPGVSRSAKETLATRRKEKRGSAGSGVPGRMDTDSARSTLERVPALPLSRIAIVRRPWPAAATGLLRFVHCRRRVAPTSEGCEAPGEMRLRPSGSLGLLSDQRGGLATHGVIS